MEAKNVIKSMYGFINTEGDTIFDDFQPHQLLAFKLYSFKFDTYLNLSMRGIKYSTEVLWRNYYKFDNIYTTDISFSDNIFGEKNNIICKNVINPLEFIFNNKDKSYEGFVMYINNVKYMMKTVYDTILSSSKRIPKPIKVYRGIKVDFSKEKIYYGFNSFTSCSLDFKVAKNFSDNQRANGDEFMSVIFGITLPIGTLISPVSTCEYINEEEILVLSTGKFDIKWMEDDDRFEEIVNPYNIFYKYIECELIISGVAEFKELEVSNSIEDMKDSIENFLKNK